jgi:arginyl-tRNA synthetase
MIKDQLVVAVAGALAELGIDPVPDGVVVERPARREHGDWSTNAALVTSKAAGRNPRELAQELIDRLDAARQATGSPPHVEAMEIAGPGFVNFRLAPTWLHDVLGDVVDAGRDGYARLDFGGGSAVNIEFVSANPTGPIHAGGGRWGAYGDSLARIMTRCGYVPHKEFYVNDRGNQTELFGLSLLARKHGHRVPEGGYHGGYIEDWAAEMPDGVDATAWGIERSLQDARETLAAMNVEFDTWSSERALVETGAEGEVLDRLKQSGLVYESDGATWLKTSEFGDSEDRVLIKSDGNYTYFTPDIAYHLDKYSRGDLLIDILGADHHGYAPRMRAALMALGRPEDSFEVIIGQNVKLMRSGEEVKMSKRAGELVEIRDLIDEVGPDVARFAYLLQSVDSPQTLDLDVLKAQAAENPVYYVQYANARIHSLGREATERGIERVPLDQADLSVLTHERELEVLRQLSVLPEVLEIACNERAPHKITTWVRELAKAFHGFWHDCKILPSYVDADVQQARLWLVAATEIGLAIGLDLLGVSAPEQM